MDFYVGWSHSDVIFTDFFPDCSVLISAVPDNRGSLKRYKRKPKKLIIDCGSVFYVKQKDRPTLKEIFEFQCQIVDDAGPGTKVTMVHFDEPLFNKESLSDRFNAVERTLFNAYEYLTLCRKSRITERCDLMGVIQGYDQSSIQYSAYELSKMGYTKFGMGSLLAKGFSKQIQLIRWAVDAVGANNLHVFGVTGIPQMDAMIDLGISSFDSTRPTMAAAYYQVFYSNPFRTFILAASRAKLSSIGENRIETPLPCECPVCVKTPHDILIPSPRHYMKLRTVHNYYHLTQTLFQMRKKQMKRRS